MMEENASLKTAARMFADEARRGLDAHPEVEQIVAYHEGKLTADAEEELQEHLALCEECGDLLLDLASFPRLGTPDLAAEGKAARQPSLEVRFAQEEDGKVIPFEPPAGPPGPAVVKTRVLSWGHAVAAVFVGVAFGLGFWVASPPLPGPQVASPPLPGPQANVEVLYLEPTKPRDTAPAAQQLPSSSDTYLLVLASYQPEPHAAYRLEVSAAGGQLIWSTDDLKKTHDDTFTLKLPSKFLPEGSYEIRLFGIGDGPPQVLDSYDLRLELD